MPSLRRDSNPSNSESCGNSVDSQDACWPPNSAEEHPSFIAEGHTKAIYGSLKKDTPETASGAYWMHHGLDPDLTGDLKAAGFKFEAK